MMLSAPGAAWLVNVTDALANLVPPPESQRKGKITGLLAGHQPG
jgi:hypothetical protein